MLFKVVEEMKTNDERAKLKVVELKEVKKGVKGKAVYEEGTEHLVAVH